MDTNSSSPSGDRDTARRGRKSGGRKQSKAKPLDETMLRDLALSYAARFATTGAKLENYLARKIRERGIGEDADGRSHTLDVASLVARLVELGYVDDDAYARSKSRDLTGRGYGAKRVEQALWAAGVDDQVREEHAPGEATTREAAALLAKKRRFGPFGDDGVKESEPIQRHKLREKRVAAMLRAGHSYEHVRFILEAANISDVEEWVDEAREEERDNHDGLL